MHSQLIVLAQESDFEHIGLILGITNTRYKNKMIPIIIISEIINLLNCKSLVN